MSPEEYKWHVEQVQNRYYVLKLTFEQAEAIFRFEEDKEFFSVESFSKWEELDFAYDTFQQVLNPGQFLRYQALHEAEVQAFQQQLTHFDAAAAKDVPSRQRQLRFYRDEPIPALYQEPLLFPFGTLNESAKEAFVVAEYQRFLQAEKKRMLIEHFRQHRQFGPHTLRSQRLRIELLGLIPGYAEFSEVADAPTKAVLQFLFDELRSHTEQLYEDVLRGHEARMTAQSRAEFEAQHGLPPEQIPGYTFRSEHSLAARLNQWALTLLWLGRNPEAYQRLHWSEEPAK